MCVEPNEVFIKTIFNACKATYQAMLNGKNFVSERNARLRRKMPFSVNWKYKTLKVTEYHR